MARTNRVTAFLSLAASLVWIAPPATLAQNQPVKVPAGRPAAPATRPVPNDSPTPVPNPAKVDPNDLRVEFSQEILRIPDIGLSVPVPADCGGMKLSEPVLYVKGGQTSTQTALKILPADMSESWSISIRAPRVNNPNLTAEESADEAFRLLQRKLAAVDAGSGLGEQKPLALKLLDRVPNPQDTRKRLFGKERQVEFVRWYARVPQGEGLSDVVRGLVVAKVMETQFVTFELTTTEPKFEEAKRIFEAVVAASSLRKVEDLGVDRHMAVQAGVNLKKSIEDADIQAIIAAKPERWFRMFKPSASGRKVDDTEVGYVRYQFRAGQRGEVDRTKAKSAWMATDRESGYLVFADARVLDGTNVFDSQASYFLRKDRETEYWIGEHAQRDLKEPQRTPQVYRQVGVREGMGFQINFTSSSGGNETIQPIPQATDAYLSRVEEFLVPQLLIKSQAQADYAYYTWVAEVRKIRLRRDTLDRPNGSTSEWRIQTRFGDEDVTQTSLYTDQGELIRTETAKGVVMEPTTYDDLLKLWTSKGLPVGSVSSKK
jgi:hypothetical protein